MPNISYDLTIEEAEELYAVEEFEDLMAVARLEERVNDLMWDRHAKVQAEGVRLVLSSIRNSYF